MRSTSSARTPVGEQVESGRGAAGAVRGEREAADQGVREERAVDLEQDGTQVHLDPGHGHPTGPRGGCARG
jgi:hypothetical protein